MAAAEITNADAIHPGYGFLAENAKFAEICGEHNIKFIGPTPDQIRAMGDKITAKETMIKAGVPVVPGGEGLLESVEQAKVISKRCWISGDTESYCRWWWKGNAGGMGRK